MRLSKQINWNLLYTFTVLAETQSVTRTAHALGRGQPAISAALKRLEYQVGQQLAERGPRYFRLTEAGVIGTSSMFSPSRAASAPRAERTS